jgi:tetratricopeptide (TPR) repeat protein
MIGITAFAQDAGDLMKQGADLFGTGKYDEAIAKYNDALKTDQTYPQGYYNLGLAYFGAKRYADAENAAVEALKRAPQNASNHRLYALVTFHQNKRGNALLAFASFLLIEPNTARSAEAVTNMQSILKGGVLKDGPGAQSLDAYATALNTAITKATATAQSQKMGGVELIRYQLNSAFSAAGQLSERKPTKDFFDEFFAAYLYKLVQSGNMPAFAHTVAQYINKDENAKWLAANPDKVDALAKWVQVTAREN